MYFFALATDYDGTLAHDGVVDSATCEAVQRFKATGRRVILVTGRELPDLKRTFPKIGMCDLVVVENGALLYNPQTEEERPIGDPPPPAFVEALKARGVPVSVGRSIVATWEPHEKVVLDVIREQGLELQIIFNKGAVMVLPAGINKAAGLAVALAELDLSPVNVAGVGDAENDHAFMRACGCAAAVSNALPAVKEEADVRLEGDHGKGVIELIDMICRDDARIVPPQRHGLLLGKDRADRPIFIEPQRGSVLIAGSSGIGKSTLATALTERMVEKRLEFCVLDPEGDYADLEHAVCVGTPKAAPALEECMELLRKRTSNVVISAQALSAAERPVFFRQLLPEITSLRASTGRPHWLVIDEAHHLIGAERGDVRTVLPENITDTIFITVHPDAVAAEALQNVHYVLALGEDANATMAMSCRAIGAARPPDAAPLAEDEVLFLERASSQPPFAVKAIRPQQQHKRHTRKYAEGELPEESSFYFRGADNRLNLRAQNLMLFVQIAQGIDADTWEHHRRNGEYSRWFAERIKDAELSREAAAIETDAGLDAGQSRERIIDAITRRYTAPARAPGPGPA